MSVHTRTLRRIGVALLFAVTAVVAGSCSDDVSRERDYLQGLDTAEQQLDQSASDLPQITQQSDAATITDEQIESINQSISRSILTLKALAPPSKWKDEHADLIAGMQQVQRGMFTLQQKPSGSKSKDQLRMREGLATVAAGSKEAEKALASIHKQDGSSS